jgi:hypothetical protein
MSLWILTLAWTCHHDVVTRNTSATRAVIDQLVPTPAAWRGDADRLEYIRPH